MHAVLLIALLASSQPEKDVKVAVALAMAMQQEDTSIAKKGCCCSAGCDCGEDCQCHYGNRCTLKCDCDDGKGKISGPVRVYRVGQPDQVIWRGSPPPAQLPVPVYRQPTPRPVYQSRPSNYQPAPTNYYRPQSMQYAAPARGFSQGGGRAAANC